MSSATRDVNDIDVDTFVEHTLIDIEDVLRFRLKHAPLSDQKLDDVALSLAIDAGSRGPGKTPDFVIAIKTYLKNAYRKHE